MIRQFCIENTKLQGLKLITPLVADDIRGEFIKDYSQEYFQKEGITHDLKEIFYTVSHRGVIRAIHFQRCCEQAKLVRVIKGRVFDIAVDLRRGSPTYGQWQGFYLDDQNKTSILIPEHFGHGYLVLDESIVSYKCAEKFYGEYNDGIIWNDSDIAIDWPLHLIDGEPILSEKDQGLQTFRQFNENYHGTEGG